MAVTFDAHFEKGAASQASPFSYLSSAGTVAGSIGVNSNRVLIVFVGFAGITSSALSVTWNSVPMSPITSMAALASSYDLYLYGLIAPATGAQTLAVSWTGGTAASIWLGGVSVFNADQATGWDNAGTDTGAASPASSTITTTNGDMAIAGHVNNNGGSTAISVGTSDWIDTAFSGNAAQGRNPAVGASTVLTWTYTGAFAWGNVKTNVRQFTGGTPTWGSPSFFFGVGN